MTPRERHDMFYIIGAGIVAILVIWLVVTLWP